jgi:hypothetical protein
MDINFANFDPKVGGSMYPRNVDNTVHIQTVQRHKRISNINNEPPSKTETSENFPEFAMGYKR